ncbi:MAG TPA: hypothetical protein VGI82_01100 [Chitinophagaceae bacterium]
MIAKLIKSFLVQTLSFASYKSILNGGWPLAADYDLLTELQLKYHPG